MGLNLFAGHGGWDELFHIAPRYPKVCVGGSSMKVMRPHSISRTLERDVIQNSEARRHATNFQERASGMRLFCLYDSKQETVGRGRGDGRGIRNACVTPHQDVVY